MSSPTPSADGAAVSAAEHTSDQGLSTHSPVLSVKASVVAATETDPDDKHTDYDGAQVASIKQLQSDMSNLFYDTLCDADQDLSDCVVQTPQSEGSISKQEYKAHKIVLCARSPWFTQAVKAGGDLDAEGRLVITIEDVTSGIMKQILHYIYTGYLKLDSQYHDSIFTGDIDLVTYRYLDMANAAEKFRLPSLLPHIEHAFKEHLGLMECYYREFPDHLNNSPKDLERFESAVTMAYATNTHVNLRRPLVRLIAQLGKGGALNVENLQCLISLRPKSGQDLVTAIMHQAMRG